LNCLEFISDAAGSKYDLIEGVRTYRNKDGDRGVACIQNSKEGVSWFCRSSWSKKLLESARDPEGKHYGNKTTTLEAVGLLLPLVTVPEKVAGKDILFKTDNISVVYGWESKNVKFDRSASILIKAATLLSAFLGCRIFVEHLPRMTTAEAVLADHLSRLSSMELEDWSMLEGAETSTLEGGLADWIESPSEDESLPFRLLEEVKNKMS